MEKNRVNIYPYLMGKPIGKNKMYTLFQGYINIYIYTHTIYVSTTSLVSTIN